MQILKQNHDHAEFLRLQNKSEELQWMKMSLEEKMAIKCLTGHIGYGLHEFYPWDCEYATMLRHPFERILSWYYYIRQKGVHTLATLCNDRSLIEVVAGEHVSETNNGMVRYLAGRKDIGINPPIGYTDEQDLLLAKIRIERFACVGIVERFEESLRWFIDCFDWEQETVYVDMLINNDRPHMSDLSPEEIEILTKYNKQDLDLYEYALELIK